MKTALIFGVGGQDGSYLSELLLSKEYRVCGVLRRASLPNDTRIRHLYKNPNFVVMQGDVTDPHSVKLCVGKAFFASLSAEPWPLEVYNLAAQSHVKASFNEPIHTTHSTYLGCLNILEVIRPISNMVRFYQASSSEMFGKAFSAYNTHIPAVGSYRKEFEDQASWSDWYQEPFQDEQTPMLPCSPYAIAKLAAHHLCRLYRESYGVFACGGILFNHESERRGEEFVTRKVAKYVAAYEFAQKRSHPYDLLALGNLDARRDWGHAKDYVRAMWLMLQQDKPDDYVIATGETHTVRELVEAAFAVVGVDKNHMPIRMDESLLRPSEVPFLRGDATKARRLLGWSPHVTFSDLVRSMVLHEMI